MIKRGLFALVLLAGCTKAGPAKDTPNREPAPTPTTREPVTPIPAVAPIPQPAPPPPVAKVATTVELTSVTLADDCGGTAPYSAPPIKAKAKRDSKDATAVSGARMKRRCEQTSMQLEVVAGDVATMHVKSVELFDDAGKSLGKLVPSKPTRWSEANGIYEAWDESLAAGTLNVSYVLSQPKWDQVGSRWNRTYRLKTVVSIGGVDQAAQKDVTLTAPTTLPPNVKT